MDDPGQDSPMPDRSAVDAELDDSTSPLATTAGVDSRGNSVHSSDSHSRRNSSQGSPDRANARANAAASSNSSSRSSGPSASSGESSKESGPPDTAGWFPIHEDLGVAPPAEIAHIEALGEFSALDESHWVSKFPELNDPEYVVSERGKIEWTISPFNGTMQNPKKDFVYSSQPVRIGGFLWRLKVFPKGLEGPYLAVNLECKKCEERRDSVISLSETTSEKIASPQSAAEPGSSPLPWRVPAQFEILVFNPQEPRVHFHKGSSQSFSEKSPSCSFKRVAPIGIADIGMRISGQRQALLRNDTLGVVAYIRTFHDETGCLFLRNAETWNSFAISGFRGIHGSRHRLQHNQSLLAAVITWLFMPPLQRIFSAVTAARAADSNLPHTPLATSLSQMSGLLKHSDASSDGSPEIEDIEGALAWHGAILDEMADVFEAWELLKSVLHEEIKSLASSILMEDFNRLGSCRFAPPYDHTRTFKEVQSLMMAFNLANTAQNDLPASDDTGAVKKPQVLHIQLPRQRFDSEKRKWKKSRRPYDLNEQLQLPFPYKLQALVLHEDSDLKSRAFSTIVRADGRNFYKYGPDYQRVVRLTKQQALADTKSSVYAAVYVLEEDESQYSSLQATNQAKLTESPDQTGKDKDSKRFVPIELTFVNANAFAGSEHPGIFDQYQLPPASVYKVTLNTPESFLELHGMLETFFLSGQQDKICFVWELDQSLSRFSPDFMIADLSGEGLSVRDEESGLFWVRVAKRGDIQPAKPSEPEASTEPVDGGANNATGPPQEGTQPEHNSSEVELGQAEDADVDTAMADVDDDDRASKVTTIDPDALSESYVFVKYFDIASQSLRGVCSYVTGRGQQIQPSVRENAPSIFEKDREYEFFEEQDPDCDTPSGVRLGPLGGAAIFNQVDEFCCIIIVQPVLSQAEKDRIALDGGIVELQSFLGYVFMKHIDPNRVAKSDEVLTRSYFGASYYEGSYSRGQPHGTGKEITLSGEEYVGSFKMGQRNGKGFLRLQNNNTYEGDFWDGRPHGTGKHVEAFTGNTYTGGFQRGKKRGRGTTEWKQAEEEGKVCRICYDNEQDCAFYPCGHVCACIECAKMASNCPMCHREGSRPFKLYFAS